jgi:hypothetical protein
MNRAQSEALEMTGTALKAALHDKLLEEQGVQIRYFFDADVIIGALFAYDELDKDLARDLPSSRSIVRALFVDGFLPIACLTLPHLDETRSVLARIRNRGGIEAYLNRQRQEISKTYGLNSKHPQIREFRRALAIAEMPDQREGLLLKMGLIEFAAIEAEVASQQLRERGFLLSRIDTEEDLGETQDLVESDDRFDLLLQSFRAIRQRKTQQQVDQLSLKSDIAALLAISRLWERMVQGNEKVECRFYTHTDPLRLLCQEDEVARALLSNPRYPERKYSRFTDAPEHALRSSAYFILRSSWPSLSFTSAVAGEDLNRERSMLTRLASTLSADAESDPHGNLVSMGLQQSLLESEQPLLDLVRRLRDVSFTKQLVSNRQSAVRDFLANGHSRELLVLSDILKPASPALICRIDKNLYQCERALDELIEARYAIMQIRSTRKAFVPWPPSAEFPTASARRWIEAGTSDTEGSAEERVRFVLARLSAKSGKELSTFVARVAQLRGQVVTTRDLCDCVALFAVGANDIILYALEEGGSNDGTQVAPSGQGLVQECLYVAALANGWAQSGDEADVIRRLETLVDAAAAFGQRNVGAGGEERNRVDGEERVSLTVAWASVYVSTAVREHWNLMPEEARARCYEVLNRCIGLIGRARQRYLAASLERDLCWAAELLLAADLGWNVAPTDLVRAIMKECAAEWDSKAASSLYLQDAFRWAAMVCWKKGNRQYDTLIRNLEGEWETAEKFQWLHKKVADS